MVFVILLGTGGSSPVPPRAPPAEQELGGG